MEFIKKVLQNDEVKRGASHFFVGLAIAAVSKLVFGDDQEPALASDHDSEDDERDE